MGGNVMVDKKKVMELVDQLRLAIPQEVKAADEVLSQKDHILNQATVDARRVKARAEDEYRDRLDQSEIIEVAQKRADQATADAEERVTRMLQQSENESRSRRTDADAYALRSLRALERQLHEINGSVRKGIDMLSLETAAVNGSAHRGDD